MVRVGWRVVRLDEIAACSRSRVVDQIYVNTRSHEQQQQQLLARFGMRRRRNARELRILTRRRQKGTVPPHTSAQDGRDVQRREGATVELAGPAGGAARAARPRGGRAERGGALALRHRR